MTQKYYQIALIQEDDDRNIIEATLVEDNPIKIGVAIKEMYDKWEDLLNRDETYSVVLSGGIELDA